MKQNHSNSSFNHVFGKEGEDVVVDYLLLHGYQIIARNFKSVFGEIDIVAQKDSIVAFVEVKLRKKDTMPLEYLVSDQKQKRILLTARLFISQQKQYSYSIFRFDVALVNYYKDNVECKYIESAFESNE